MVTLTATLKLYACEPWHVFFCAIYDCLGTGLGGMASQLDPDLYLC